jgi:hypothetical protein
MTDDVLFSLIIEVGGCAFRVPRSITAEGGDATEQWLAAQLLDAAPAERLDRMNRADLEAEAARIGMTAVAPEGADVDPLLLVLPAEAGAQLVNADYVRCIEARRAALAALAYVEEGPPPAEGAAAEVVP